MFKQLFSDNRIFYGLVCLLVFIAGGLLYLQTVKQEAKRDVQRTQGVATQQLPPKTEAQPAPPKPPPPGETAESGHWHGDVWHAGPHTPQEVSEVTPDVQDAQGIAQQANGQINASTQEASARPQETGKAVYAPGSFDEWLTKNMELMTKDFQVVKKLADIMPDTAEGWERLRTDEQLKRELIRKLDEMEVELGEAVRAYNAHQKKKPVGP